MSTQHPDNACTPTWCKSEIIEGESEIYEAFFAYNELGCHEVMWDSEGKDVDLFVIRKLLSRYEHFFRDKIIGKNLFLTYRIPNPRIDRAERKVVMETLLNILVSADVASAFYKKETIPIFEIILPFTTDGSELVWLSQYYRKAIAGLGKVKLDRQTKASDWLGSLRPKKIEIIPLVEDFDSTVKIDQIVETYIDSIRPKYVRVFLARSDPALNYGLITAVILTKIALSKLKLLGARKETNIYPILGVGSLPFRGNLSPNNLDNFLNEYQGVNTVTIQSTLKYDYSLDEVKNVVKILNERLPYGEVKVIEPYEEKILIQLISKFKSGYQSTIEKIAPLINKVATYIPQRRARKLHVGLFGYSRSIGGISLPRAITFTAVLYSLGIPPELIGYQAFNYMKEEEWDLLTRFYKNLKKDLEMSAGYFSWQNMNMLSDMWKEVAKRASMAEDVFKLTLTKLFNNFSIIEENLGVRLGPRTLDQKKHENMINNFLISFIKDEKNENDVRRHLVEAAIIRRSLG